MPGNLQSRKQELVRNAIYDAAIELFAKNGFDHTTVEEIAQAAGVSRRSFFRYFATKDDLLALSVLNYGRALSSAVAACPPSFTPLEVIHKTVSAGAKYAALQTRTRQTIAISEKSAAARRAHQSRFADIEELLAEAFAARLKRATKNDLKPRMFAGLTLMATNLAIASWYREEHGDLAKSSRQVFAGLASLFGEGDGSSRGMKRVAQEKASTVRARTPSAGRT